METQLLRAFLTVADQQSVSKAAERLHLTQPAISKQVQSLESQLGIALFDRIGGSDWSCTRQAVYGGNRGDVGRLALAVAEAADQDPAALAILRSAGEELARLAHALIGRCGPRPVALSGRAAGLHPAIEATLRAALPAGIPFSHRPSRGHHAAARLALRAALGAPS